MPIQLNLQNTNVVLRDIHISENKVVPGVQLAYIKSAMSDLIYQAMAASSVWLDVTPKNQVFREQTNAVIDQAVYALGKTAAETQAVADQTLYELRKGINLDLAIIEATAIEMQRPLADVYSAEEVVALLLERAVAHAVAALDESEWHFTKGVPEVVLLGDAFTRVASYSRQFDDYVSADDFSNIDKYYDANKTNIAAVVDHSYMALGRVLEEQVGTADAHNFAMGRALYDAVLQTDEFMFDLARNAGTDTINVMDETTVTHIGGATLRFNHSMFNQSTFG